MKHPVAQGSTTTSAGRNHLSIREVLDLLAPDFPDVTISKIRFLESRGLIHPERTPSGYRKFYKGDVDRLRWILTQQREHYLPLNVIKVRLDGEDVEAHDDDDASSDTPSLFSASDFGTPAATLEAPQTNHGEDPPTDVGAPHVEGTEPTTEATRGLTNGVGEFGAAPDAPRNASEPSAEHAPGGDHAPAVVPAEVPSPAPAAARTDAIPDTPGHRAPTRGTRGANATGGPSYTIAELAAECASDGAFIAELESYGLISGREVSGLPCFGEEALVVARLAQGFRSFGIEPRHLKSLQHAAVREADLFAQVVIPLLRQRNPDAHSRAERDLSDLVGLGESIKAAFLQSELRNLTGS